MQLSKKTKARLYRHAFNAWPCIVGTGGRITHIADDFTKLRVELSLNWRTRNAVGTIFGGSMYASTDPFYMLMLMQILGDQYIIWDKGCTLRFRRPAMKTMHADFEVTPEMLADVKQRVAENGSTEVVWTVCYRDDAGVTYAEFDKVLYIATKEHYAKRKARAR